MSIRIKTKEEIKLMQVSGRVNSRINTEAFKLAKPGVSTFEINEFIEKEIKKEGMQASFKEVDNYQYASCININEGVVHGIPSKNVVIKDGDVLTIDIGVKHKGLHSDSSWTSGIGNVDPSLKQFLERGEKTLYMAIDKCQIGARIGDVSSLIQKQVEGYGYNVIKDFVGHGVGYSIHEDPQIPCYGKANTGPIIKKGMVLAVEIMYTMGQADIKEVGDGWTYVTRDGSVAGMFEHTVAVTTAGPLVLTSN